MRLLIAVLIFAPTIAFGQPSTSRIFAHNDYEKPVPFNAAYRLNVGYIEADVFLIDGELFVAHTESQVEKSRTLDALYLNPLKAEIIRHDNEVYAGGGVLSLMIDLKTEGKSTLNALVRKLNSYPEIINCKSVRITISGDVPNPSTWNEYPNYIYFDGRPTKTYSPEQLQRVNLVSASFRDYSSWNGKGEITVAERERISEVINKVHAMGKPVRFWASPDFTNAWIKLLKIGVDVLNTDDPENLHSFFTKWSTTTFQSKTAYVAYQPTGVWTPGSKPKNLIIMIGDGTGLAQWYSGYTANRGQLNVFNIPTTGYSITSSSDSYITDSAAGATAIATGSKTKNRYVGVDSKGEKLPSLTKDFVGRNFHTAIISNGDITDATPASFFAFNQERSMSEAIALDFLQSNVDILLGGGVNSFVNRNDKRNLFIELQKKGYRTAARFQSIDTISANRFVILDDSAVVAKRKGRGDFLARSLNKSLHVFTKSKTPFFVMLEGAQIDWGGHENNLEYVVTEVLDFDQAIGEAIRFADQNKETLILVTADHETGGLSLIDGDIERGYVHGSFSTSDHTGVAVPVFAYGPGAELFTGVHQNTELNQLIRRLFSFR